MDSEGCIKLPRDIIELFDINEKTELHMHLQNDKLLIEKVPKGCVFCGSYVELIGIADRFVCNHCRNKLAKGKIGDYIY